MIFHAQCLSLFAVLRRRLLFDIPELLAIDLLGIKVLIDLDTADSTIVILLFGGGALREVSEHKYLTNNGY